MYLNKTKLKIVFQSLTQFLLLTLFVIFLWFRQNTEHKQCNRFFPMTFLVVNILFLVLRYKIFYLYYFFQNNNNNNNKKEFH